MRFIVLIIITLSSLIAKSQTYPSFGSEIDVTINGLSFDAMEPFVSANGNYLFFNNLNDGVNTKLYYATKINDSTFNYTGELNGTNQSAAPHLDAVADIDSSNNFYWTSTRNYPADLDNLFYGNFNNGNVTNIGRVRGNFNKNIPGWLVMDHGISYNGEFLYYNNARLDNNNCTGPCQTELGIAKKINDSTFSQLPNSNTLLQNINDTNYIYYAPCISSDNLELYYTRYAKGDSISANTTFEICVAVRSTPTDNFSIPNILFSEPIANLIEAPTLTTDKNIMYYHRKIPGSHKIVMRYRESPLSIKPSNNTGVNFHIYPNPANDQLNIKTTTNYNNINISVLSLFGKLLISQKNKTKVDINTLPSGTYFVKIEIDDKIEFQKFVKAK
ncbi:MAG: T9SS type A sorting domain-containing protein [Vicingaceae bacterium]